MSPISLPSFLLFLSTHILLLQTTSSTSISTDLESLLAFRDHVSDSSGILAANWTTNTSFCSWIGISCGQRHPRVNTLSLNSFSLQGTISPYLGNLSFLDTLNLANNSLTGPVPESLSRLPRLRILRLGTNKLSGHIPPGFFNMTSLVSVYLQKNNLTGILPSNSSFVMSPLLQNISLGQNQLSGPIPSGFASCQNLQLLYLSGNEFSGTIPEELSTLPKLTILYLSSNQLSGTIPKSLGNLTTLQALQLNYNQLEGTIPETFENLHNLQELYAAANHLTGSIPANLFNLSMLQVVEISFNNLTGSIPVTLGKSLPQLAFLYLSMNQLTGGLDFLTSLSQCRNLVWLDIPANKLEGSIPDSVGNLSASLQHLQAAQNRISGNIPAEFGNLTSLSFLDLGTNQLTGTIPTELFSLQRMELLDLDQNMLTGSIPSELGLMTRMNRLRLQTNQLSGPIPDSVGNLTALQHLAVQSNGLSSRIPASLWSLSNLIELFVYENNLSGSIPSQVANLNSLDKMDLSRNHLSGDISPSFGKLQMLTYLDLSTNSFQGQIPESFGELINVQYMNLSHNSLSNTIPKSLAGLHYLSALDLSFNKLEGEIPKGRVFSNLSIPTLIGNPALCGAPKLSFSPCPMKDGTSSPRRESHLLVYVLTPIASVIVIFIFICVLLRCRRKSRAKAPDDGHMPKLADCGLISYYELARATDNFSEANLLGRGGTGSVYRACLDNGLVTAVKVFNLEVQGALKSFDAECQALRMVRHRNLVKIISTCSNLEFKALILEFMINGNLETWLHSDDYHLSLHQRLNIMVDVALALEYLHHDQDNIVLHCDLKPTNILLDEDMTGHLADFGIAKLLYGDNSSAVLTSTRGTIGYMPPEYSYSGKVSIKGDVYSFGILLLETTTRRRPTDPMFNEGLNLRQWVNNAYPAEVLQIADCNLLRDDYLKKKECLTTIQQCLASIVELGLLCSRDSPKERILMEDVVPRIQNIRAEYLAELPDSKTH